MKGKQNVILIEFGFQFRYLVWLFQSACFCIWDIYVNTWISSGKAEKNASILNVDSSSV